MKQINKTVILGVIAILIIILIILMTFIYVNDIREEQLKKLQEEEKDEISLSDQIKNLTYYLDLYRGEDLIYGQGIVLNSSSTANGYFLLEFNEIEYHPRNLPEQYQKVNLTINFIASKNESIDPFSSSQYIDFLRIENNDIEITKE